MSVGDIGNNIDKLRHELKALHYPGEVDAARLRAGDPATVLPLLHFGILGFSRLLARYLSAHGYELYAKTDARFVEGAFRFLRNELQYRPALTVEQFLSPGFAERKLLLLIDVMKLCKRKHNELYRELHGGVVSSSVAGAGMSGVSSSSAAAAVAMAPSAAAAAAPHAGAGSGITVPSPAAPKGLISVAWEAPSPEQIDSPSSGASGAGSAAAMHPAPPQPSVLAASVVSGAQRPLSVSVSRADRERMPSWALQLSADIKAALNARIDALETRVERMLEPLAARMALLEARMAAGAAAPRR